MGDTAAEPDIDFAEEVTGRAVVCSRLFVQFLSVHLGEAEPIEDTPSTHGTCVRCVVVAYIYIYMYVCMLSVWSACAWACGAGTLHSIPD